jgi:hypothetical protein
MSTSRDNAIANAQSSSFVRPFELWPHQTQRIEVSITMPRGSSTKRRIQKQ